MSEFDSLVYSPSSNEIMNQSDQIFDLLGLNYPPGSTASDGSVSGTGATASNTRRISPNTAQLTVKATMGIETIPATISIESDDG